MTQKEWKRWVSVNIQFFSYIENLIVWQNDTLTWYLFQNVSYDIHYTPAFTFKWDKLNLLRLFCYCAFYSSFCLSLKSCGCFKHDNKVIWKDTPSLKNFMCGFIISFSFDYFYAFYYYKKYKYNTRYEICILFMLLGKFI